MNQPNIFTEREQLANTKNIGKQLEINNRIAILDRLYTADAITQESYVEELKELLKESTSKKEV